MQKRIKKPKNRERSPTGFTENVIKKLENEHAIFRPNQEGLKKLLGELEARIMELVWALNYPVTVKEIHQIMLKQGESHSYTTIMTVMSRLEEKELLRITEVQRRANVYQATCTREAFIEKSAAYILDSLIKDFPDVVFKHFVKAAQESRISGEQLQNLQKRIQAKRHQEQEPPC